ncbi:NAD-dependent histone deacetylase HST3 [Ilyonectria robusta]
MPTTHVQPDSHEELQGIANALLKARKVVVVTGAGISTNSGIPAQFDAAARQARQAELALQSDNENDNDDKAGGLDNGRESKRRRLSCDNISEPSNKSHETEEEIQVKLDLEAFQKDDSSVGTKEEDELPEHKETRASVMDTLPLITPRRTRRSIAVARAMTSPLSSPPPEDLIVPPTGFRKRHATRLADLAIPPSSPLSSPPPVLFDPFELGSPLEDNSSRRSTSPSEVDDSPPTNPISLSQTSTSGRNTLPNMKGKDLFDAAIWSDPLRTSVFYTFATTLRQKVKDIEPTSSHRFIGHLRDRGKLVRCYTQNIDQIEEKVGLSTSLKDGPGSRGRFSRRSTANMAQLNKMVEEASSITTDQSSSDKSQPTSDSEPSQQSQASQSEGTETPVIPEPEQSSDNAKAPAKNPRRELPRSGVECVFLHGSLELLRCFLCGRVCSWDDGDRELETMSGQQPECPHCVGATTAREEKGKRALGVGKLRPDIVLYGEEHPNSHLISPIVTHDLALNPDLLLILGTSLRVHGLKVMVREFAKAVHTRGGKVVFVNFTKPPESSWGDVIDYWIEWDCDAWVADLQDKVPKLWQEPEPPKPKKKRESNGASEDGDKTEMKKPPPANPVALRDTKVTGAYWTMKIMSELHRITGPKEPERRASISVPVITTFNDIPINSEVKALRPKPRTRRPRKSAPGALERPKKLPSTLNPNHGRSRHKAEPAKPAGPTEQTSTPKKPLVVEQTSSILDSVKSNPRVRKRKKIDGEEVVMPTVGKRRTAAEAYRPSAAELELPPLRPQPPSSTGSRFGKPIPLEPRSPPAGPLASISVNMRGATIFKKKNAFFIDDPLVKALQHAPTWWQATKGETTIVVKHGSRPEEANAALALAGLSQGSPVVHEPPGSTPRGIEMSLRSWGTRWSSSIGTSASRSIWDSFLGMVYLRTQRRRQGETKTPDRYDNLMRRLGSGNQTLNCHEDLSFTQHIGELTWCLKAPGQYSDSEHP